MRSLLFPYLASLCVIPFLPLSTCLPFSCSSNLTPREENAYLHGIFLLITRFLHLPLLMSFELGMSKKVYVSRKRSTRIWKLDLQSGVCVTCLYGTAHIAFRLSHRYCVSAKPLLACRFSSWPSAYSARQDFMNAASLPPTAD